MRTLSTAQTAVAALSDRASYVKVEVHDGSSWRDLANWLLSVEYGEKIDGKMADAIVTVKARDHEISISPLCTSSVINATNVLLSPHHQVRIYAAVMALGSEPESTDWMQVFIGRIDQVDIDDNVVRLRCRDSGGDLSDAFIEDERTYGTAVGRNVEDVMQDILTDWGGGVTLFSETGTAGTPFQVGDSPGWLITEYNQRREPVLEALRNLADMIGWTVRYRWNTDTAAYQLVFSEPDRAKAAPDRTFEPSEYTTLGTTRIDRQTIRNVVTVYYRDSANGFQWAASSASDAASIAAYGRLWMEVAEEASSQIDTSTEADAMRDAILTDLKDPTITLQARVPFFPWAELGDLYRFGANGTTFDSDQDLAPIAIRHSLSRGGAWTTLTCRGQPSSGVARWLSKQAVHPKREYGVRNQVTDVVRSSLCPNGDFGGWAAQ